MLEQQLAEKGQGEAGVENVFNEDDVFALARLVEVLDELDGSAGVLALAVAGDGDEIESAIDGDTARKISEKNGRAFEDSDENDALASEVSVDLPAELGGALCDLRRSEQNGAVLVMTGRMGVCEMAGGSHGIRIRHFCDDKC